MVWIVLFFFGGWEINSWTFPRNVQIALQFLWTCQCNLLKVLEDVHPDFWMVKNEERLVVLWIDVCSILNSWSLLVVVGLDKWSIPVWCFMVRRLDLVAFAGLMVISDELVNIWDFFWIMRSAGILEAIARAGVVDWASLSCQGRCGTHPRRKALLLRSWSWTQLIQERQSCCSRRAMDFLSNPRRRLPAFIARQ